MARMAWRNAGRSSTATAKCWISRFIVYCCCPVSWNSWSTCNSFGRLMLLYLLSPPPWEEGAKALLLLFLCMHLYHPAIALSLAHHRTRPQHCPDGQSCCLQGLRYPGVTRVEQAIVALS